jgi:hypothetical protein
MSELDAGSSAFGVEEFDDVCERRDLRFFPQAEIGIGNAAFRRDSRRFENDKSEAADGEASQMDEVPVIGEAVSR